MALDRSTRRLERSIEMVLKETCGNMDWTLL